MQVTEQDVLNLLSTQRLTNENFQLRDLVQELSKKLADATATMEKSAATTDADNE